ncbi:type II restriction endonuclease [Mameliella alba]|uniref:Putative Type II restriction endonuclease n=1 Tax=Mameliella alba TaxID=561184 RepID=A0A0B3RPQ2_9RHOB|nr:type II restriction endonuclease [Mameliella alba]KHQ49787.1 putative Type II restriction endonuclease [Mameliella alba]GAW37105.1 type-2 restriction enzyme EcoRII [Roseovarius sp. A-2]
MIKRGQLSDYFEGVGVKRLSAVDAEPKTSNQHEVGTTKKMRDDFLGENHQEKFPAIYIWLGGDQEGFTEESWATHYDARLNKPRAAEWRLYYPSNPVTEAMKAGDTLFLAKDQGGVLWFIVAPEGSTSEQQLFWLFGLRPEGKSFVSREFSDEEPELDFAARFILDEIGVEFEEPEADKLDSIIDRFGTTFPKTAEFSDLARLTLPEVRAEDDPDAALIAWLDHEEALFRRLERRVVSSRIEAGFTSADGTDVDGFISFSLSVQNRRKSRMGHSLENHMAAVLRAHDIRHVRGAVTEHKHKPDFLFPDLETYHAAPAGGDARLTMLGAKSTCKDRWRQVLAEAEKISRKHLLTLEPGISEPQTDQMEASSLQLVVPSPVQDSYTAAQRGWLWSVGDFIEEVRARQGQL